MERPCPTCRQPAAQERTNPNRPFCSERCRMIDLGRWLEGDYALPGEPAEIPETGNRTANED